MVTESCVPPNQILLGCSLLTAVIVFVVSNSVAGESSLDRLACGLGGKTVLPHIIVTVPQMLQNGKFLTESTSAYKFY